MSVARHSWVGLVAIVLAVSLASSWWVNRHERNVGAQAAALARPGDIRMLSSQSCAVCVVARTWFRANKIPYSECLIERDPACRAAFEAGGYAGTPVIVVRGRTQLGFSPEWVVDALAGRS
jgi:glutaredoxin